MFHKTICTAALLAACTTAASAATVFQSASNSDNGAVRADWVTAIGEAPEFIQDWESGFADEERVEGSVGNGLSVDGTNDGGEAKIEFGAGSIGGSNPIGGYALEVDDSNGLVLTLTFASAISYLGFISIDHGPGDIDFGAGTAELLTTNASGDSGLFTGFDFSLGEDVTTVTFSNVTGAANWGIDNIEYGYFPIADVPVPAALPLLAFALGGLGVMRRRTRR